MEILSAASASWRLIFVIVATLQHIPTIRRAGIHDAIKLRKLASYEINESPPALSWWLQQIKRQPSNCWLIMEARDTRSALGFIRLKDLAESHGLPARQHVSLFAIHKKFRRQGHGTRLLSYALQCLDAEGACCVSLFVRPSNEGAKRLYERLGFVPHTRVLSYYTADGEDALLCVRWRARR